MPIPDGVAVVVGRLIYYAAWLDDFVADAVIAGSLHESDESDTTPGWATSGKQLVAALRRIDVGQPQVTALANQLADHLENMNTMRNQLVHGVWLWESKSVMVMKRSLSPGRRSIDYARYTYSELLGLVAEYRRLGQLAERFAQLLEKGNPAHARAIQSVTPMCSVDGELLEGAIVDDQIVWQCATCGTTMPAVPDAAAGDKLNL